MIYAFLVDSSVAMNAKFGRISYLDACKGAIEHLLRWQLRLQDKTLNTYLICDYAQTLVVSQDSHVVMECVKRITATSQNTAGQALARLFGRLDLMRIANANDSIGSGRLSALPETAVIFWFTLARKFTSTGVSSVLNIPGLDTPGADLYLEPFRWEQRLYTVVLADEFIDAHIQTMSACMGGACWLVPTVGRLLQLMDDSLGVPSRRKTSDPFPTFCHIQGVSVMLAAHPDNLASINERLFLYTNQSNSRAFPIPECYWLDPTTANLSLPRRKAHPIIMVSTRDQHHSIFEGFPVDRISMEQSPFVLDLANRKAGTCWTVNRNNAALC